MGKRAFGLCLVAVNACLLMSPYVQLTIRKKAVAIALAKEGYSTRMIAKKICCNQSTVSRVLKLERETGDVQRRAGSGRKRVTTKCQDRYLKRMSIKNRHASAPDLKVQLENACGVSVSARTVQRRLVECGLLAYRPKKKPLLTNKMKQKRLSWAKQHVSWTMDQWNSVIFSDESKFNLYGSDGKQYVRRRKNEAFHPDCISPTVKFPAGQMIWGSISSKGVGRLKFITGTVNASIYSGILDECLKPVIRDHFKRARHCIFQHDSAPCHTAKAVSGISFFPAQFFASFTGFHTHNKTDI